MGGKIQHYIIKTEYTETGSKYTDHISFQEETEAGLLGQLEKLKKHNGKGKYKIKKIFACIDVTKEFHR